MVFYNTNFVEEYTPNKLGIFSDTNEGLTAGRTLIFHFVSIQSGLLLVEMASSLIFQNHVLSNARSTAHFQGSRVLFWRTYRKPIDNLTKCLAYFLGLAFPLNCQTIRYTYIYTYTYMYINWLIKCALSYARPFVHFPG